MKSKTFNRRDFVKVASLAAASTLAVRSKAPGQAKPKAEESAKEKTVKHPVVHFESGCRDLAATKDFYQKMFDWPIDEQFQIAGAGLAGHLTSLGHEPEHYTMFYVEVEDVAAAIAKAESLGGRKIMGPVTIPPGTFAWITDTQQNTIGLWKAK